MAIETPHVHVGFRVQFDSLIQRGVIHVNPFDWSDLHANTAAVASKFSGTEEEAQANTDINATVIGPISGPDAGTGPLVAVGSLEAPAVLVPNPDDSKPNLLSEKITLDGTEHLVAAEPMEQPYPTDPVTPEPTETQDDRDQQDAAAFAQEPEPPAEEHHEGE